MLLSDKVACITGAGSGVGRASAVLFARAGASVVCGDIRDDWLKDTLAQVGDEERAVACSCDVRHEDQVAELIAAARRRFGRVDVMFNNAGVGTEPPGRRFETNDDAEWDRLVSVNLRGVFYGCKQAVLAFQEQGGGECIVNTASVAGLRGWGGALYGATKGGVIALTRLLAMEYAGAGIRVNCVCPGAIDTNFQIFDEDRKFQPRPVEVTAALDAQHPLGRMATADDVAGAAMYLASDLASNVTGVALPVDGGLSAGVFGQARREAP
jgi:NAD(P)-dependent dehydrogenase (short-subunit alcohol dehydrogenase family)